MTVKNIKIVVEPKNPGSNKPTLKIPGKLIDNKELSFENYIEDESHYRWFEYDIGGTLLDYTRKNPNIKIINFTNSQLDKHTMHYIVSSILGGNVAHTLILDGIQINDFSIDNLVRGIHGGSSPHYYEDITKAPDTKRVVNPVPKILSLRGCFKEKNLGYIASKLREALHGVEYPEVEGKRSLDFKIIIDSPELYNLILNPGRSDNFDDKEINSRLKLYGQEPAPVVMQIDNNNTNNELVDKSSFALVATELSFARTTTSILGRGTFAKVYKGKLNGEDVAVKVNEELEEAFNNPYTPTDEKNEMLSEFEAEAQTLIEYRNPHLVEIKAYGTYLEKIADGEANMEDENDNFAEQERKDYITLHVIVMEVLTMRLTDYINKTSSDPKWETFVMIATHVAEGLKYLHNHVKSMVHSDLKPDNVMLFIKDNKVEIAKLTDVGVSARVYERTLTERTYKHGKGGTPKYMSPEQLADNEKRCDKKAEMFSYGLTVANMLTQNQLHQGVKDLNAHYTKWDGIFSNSEPVNLTNIKNPDNGSYTLREVASLCLLKDPDQRATANGVVEYLSAHSSPQNVK